MNLTTDGATMNHIVKKILFVTTIFLAVIFVASCASIPKEIPLELSAKELNQKSFVCDVTDVKQIKKSPLCPPVNTNPQFRRRRVILPGNFRP